MKNNRLPTLLLTIAAFIIGVFIMAVIQANNKPVQQVDPRNEELIRSIATMEAEIAALEEQRRLINEQISAIHASQSAGESQLSLLNQNLDALRQTACLTEMQGPGLSVIIDDNKEGADKARSSNPETFFPEHYIIHDKDLLYIVRALAPYAEAIAINNVRLNDTFHIRCAGTVILVNYAILAPPYEIRAIGDPEILLQALQYSSRYQTLVSKMMPVKVSTAEDLLLPGYGGTYSLNYIKPVKENTIGALQNQAN